MTEYAKALEAINKSVYPPDMNHRAIVRRALRIADALQREPSEEVTDAYHDAVQDYADKNDMWFKEYRHLARCHGFKAMTAKLMEEINDR